MMAKSERSHPYRHSRMEASSDSTQNSVGLSTRRARSESIHCTSMRAENRPCARKPMSVTTMDGMINN